MSFDDPIDTIRYANTGRRAELAAATADARVIELEPHRAARRASRPLDLDLGMPPSHGHRGNAPELDGIIGTSLAC